MTSLGFLVLARRPNPNGHGYTHEIVTMRDGTNMAVMSLEGAQNVKESCEKQQKQSRTEYDDDPFVSDSVLRYDEPDPVEYVIGEIRSVSNCGHCGANSGHSAYCPGQLS